MTASNIFLTIPLLLVVLIFPLATAYPVQDLTLTLHYEREPPGRGTMAILTTCIITFVLCTWTSVHPNILPPSSTGVARLKYKLLWMCFTMLFPHGTMLCAFGQWREAKRLHAFWQDRFEINVQNQVDHMGVEGGFFALMGGFTLPKADGGEVTPVLTPYGFVKYVQAGLIDQRSFDRKFINDKGKASSVAKLVTLVQAGWLIFQCVTRIVAGLPITLLEIHVANQVLCAAVSYFFWWHKPLDVNEPMEIVLKAGSMERQLGARGESVYYAQRGCEVVERSRSGMLVLLLRAIYDVSEFLFGGESQARLAISGTGLENSMGGGEARKNSVHEVEVKGEVTDRSEELELEFSSTEISGATRNARTPTSVSANKSNHLPKPRNIVHKLVVGVFLISGGAFHLSAWNIAFTSTLERLLWLTSCIGIIIGSLVLTTIFVVVDWENQFLCALWETRFYDKGLCGHVLARFVKESRKEGSWWGWANVYVAWALVGMYVGFSVFITVESFAQLRRLEKEFYETPVWDGWWPGRIGG